MVQSGPDASLLARKALDWLLQMAHEHGTDLAWTGRPDDDELDPTLYSGTAGMVLALLEGYQHFGEERYAQAAVRGARTLAAAVAQEWPLSALYFGLAGLAFALREVGGRLGDRQAAQAAVSALDLVALAATGHAAGRADLVDLALAGAADVVSRNEAGPDGFLVPHSDRSTSRNG